MKATTKVRDVSKLPDSEIMRIKVSDVRAIADRLQVRSGDNKPNINGETRFDMRMAGFLLWHFAKDFAPDKVIEL